MVVWKGEATIRNFGYRKYLPHLHTAWRSRFYLLYHLSSCSSGLVATMSRWAKQILSSVSSFIALQWACGHCMSRLAKQILSSVSYFFALQWACGHCMAGACLPGGWEVFWTFLICIRLYCNFGSSVVSWIKQVREPSYCFLLVYVFAFIRGIFHFFSFLFRATRGVCPLHAR